MFIKKFIELWSFKDRALFENSFAEGLGASGVTMIGMDERARSLGKIESQRVTQGSGSGFYI